MESLDTGREQLERENRELRERLERIERQLGVGEAKIGRDRARATGRAVRAPRAARRAPRKRPWRCSATRSSKPRWRRPADPAAPRPAARARAAAECLDPDQARAGRRCALGLLRAACRRSPARCARRGRPRAPVELARGRRARRPRQPRPARGVRRGAAAARTSTISPGWSAWRAPTRRCSSARSPTGRSRRCGYARSSPTRPACARCSTREREQLPRGARAPRRPPEWGVKLLARPRRAAAEARPRAQPGRRGACRTQVAERTARAARTCSSAGSSAWSRERADRLAAELAKDVHAQLCRAGPSTRSPEPARRTASCPATRATWPSTPPISSRPIASTGCAGSSSELEARHRALGARLELTGPWPPYNFVPREAGAPRSA